MILDSNIIIYSVIPENIKLREFLKLYKQELIVSKKLKNIIAFIDF